MLLLASICILQKTKIIETRNAVAVRWSFPQQSGLLAVASTLLTSNSFVDRGGKSADQLRVAMYPLFFASSMTALAGCSHVLCIKRFQCYAAMMTGNIIGLGVALAEGNMSEAKFRLSLIGSFFAGTICARLQRQAAPQSRCNNSCSCAVGLFALSDKIPDHQKRKLTPLSAGYGLVSQHLIKP